ncbi:MAG: BolA/IbaG family iron-sulfur metabolism protein [Comamonadaceae bacterium]|nr:BolA/IbaG family iron-sulfur metabolism protein [Comamonadaceae bacterium]
MTAEELQSLIQQGLECQHIELQGDGRHWFATIVSPAFEGLGLIQRQRLVYATLGQRLHTDEVHALSMKTLTPAQWQAQQGAQ